jgi:hypothetical protein
MPQYGIPYCGTEHVMSILSVTIPEAAYGIYNYDVDLLKMSRAMLETYRGF